MEKIKNTFADLVEISAKLRKECPWDKEQTLESFQKYLVDEAIEAQHAVAKKDYDELKEELGDVLWNVLFMVNIAKEQNLFDVHDVLETAKEKMIRRHPHVFGDASRDIESIHKKWQEIKAEEKAEKEKRKKEEEYKSIPNEVRR